MTTVSALLCPRSTDLTDRLRTSLRRSTAVADLVSAVTGIPDPVPTLARALGQLLDSPVGGLLDTAWTDQADVRRAIAETDGKDATVAVPLVNERVTITDTIHVEIAGIERPTLEPTLTVTIDIENALLTIHAGAVERVTPSRATATATLMLGPDVLVTGPTSRVELPAFPRDGGHRFPRREARHPLVAVPTGA
jgi:hypothetical protein